MVGSKRPSGESPLPVRAAGRPILLGSAFLVALCIGFGLVFWLRTAPPPPAPTSVSTAQVPSDQGDDTRLWFVYIGSPDCPWSTLPETQEAVRSLKNRLWRYAVDENMGFTALGVVNAVDFDAGLDHLRPLGRFDNVSIGEPRSNAITLDYFWNAGLVPSTPQVALFERTILRSDRGSLPPDFAGTTVRRLRHASGSSALSAWAASSDVLVPSKRSHVEHSLTTAKETTP